MIVPYVKQKPITYKDKIVSIIKNKSIIKVAKIILINNFISNLNKNENLQLSTLIEDIKSQIPEKLDWFYEGFNIENTIIYNTNTLLQSYNNSYYRSIKCTPIFIVI